MAEKHSYQDMQNRIEKLEREKQHLQDKFKERKKELSCIYKISNLIENEEELPQIIRGTANILSQSWQYPNITCTKIELDGKEFKTDNYQEPSCKQRADLIVHSKKSGYIEVGYLKEKPDEDEGPFLKEERNLLNAVAERLGRIIERKQATKELQLNKERLQLALHGAQLGLWDWNIKTDKVHFNERWAEMLGYNLEEIDSRLETWEKFTHPDDLKIAHKRLTKHFKRETDYYECEMRMRHKSGKWLWIQDIGKVIEWDQDGKPVRACGIHLDITDKKENQLKLQRSREKYKNLFEYINNGVAVYEPINNGENFVFKNFNRAGEEIEDISREEVIGKNVTEVFPRVKEFGLFKVLQEVWKNGQPQHHPVSIYKDDRIQGWRDNYVYKLPGGEVVAVYEDNTKQKQAEVKLKRNEKDLRTTLNSIGDAVISTGLDGNIVRMNPIAEELTGWNKQEAIGKPINEIFKIFNDKTGERVKNPVFKVIEQEKIVGLANHTVLKSKDGSEYQIADSGAPIKDENGGITGVVLAFRDVTEEYRMRERIRQNEKKFRSIMSSMHDIVYTLDTKQRHTGVYGPWVENMGLTEEHFLGKTACEIMGQENGRVHEKANKKALKGNFVTYEWSTKTEDGTLFFQTSLSPIFDENNSVEGLVGIGRNITERKKTEEKLKEQKAYFEELIESAPEAITILNVDDRVTRINREFTNLFGFTKQEARGQRINDLIVPENLKDEGEQATGDVADGKRIQLETVRRNKNGDKIHVSILGKPIKSDDQIIAVYGIYRDISDRVQAEKEKDKLQMQLLQTQKLESIGNLAGGVAHDFNNILTVIMGLSELMMNKIDNSDPKYNHIKNIHESGKRAAKLTEQLLLFSRKQDMEFEVISINRTLENLNKMLKRLIGEDIIMHNELDPDLWSVEADRNQIEQVITNLAVNARDAMPEGGELTISTRNVIIDKDKAKTIPDIEPGRYIRLNVEDTGHGMGKETQKKIFDPFFTTKGRAEGTGMGLAVVHGIVKEHNGLINVYSEPDKGTVFKIYIPAASDEVKSKQTKKSEHYQKYEGSGETILIVEDEGPVLKYLESILDDYGYSYYSAKSGERALEIFDNNGDIDLLLSDVIMTGMDGVELANRLKNRKDDLQVILSSGYSNKKVSKAKIRDKGYRFIQKPYDILQLLKVIHETIRKSN